MHTTSTHFIGPKDCPYKINGQNLVELRRPALRKIARAIKVEDGGIKNELLGRIIVRLRTIEAPQELSEL